MANKRDGGRRKPSPKPRPANFVCVGLPPSLSLNLKRDGEERVRTNRTII